MARLVSVRAESERHRQRPGGQRAQRDQHRLASSRWRQAVSSARQPARCCGSKPITTRSACWTRSTRRRSQRSVPGKPRRQAVGQQAEGGVALRGSTSGRSARRAASCAGGAVARPTSSCLGGDEEGTGRALRGGAYMVRKGVTSSARAGAVDGAGVPHGDARSIAWGSIGGKGNGWRSRRCW